MPKWSYATYIEHFKISAKPTIVYSFSSLKGTNVVDHWVNFLAQEGRGSKNLMFVQDSTSTTSHGTSCEAFNKLPRSVKDRNKITVVLNEPKFCETIPQSYTVKVGRYELTKKTEARQYDTYVPKWECERTADDWDCYGEIDEADYAILESHFLA